MSTQIGNYTFRTSKISHIDLDKFKVDILMQTSDLAKKYQISQFYAKKLREALYTNAVEDSHIEPLNDDIIIDRLEKGNAVVVSHEEYLNNRLLSSDDDALKDVIKRQYKGRIGKVNIKIDDGMIIVEFSD